MSGDKEEIEAYSPETDTTYPSWDALVAAESNGFVVVGLITSKTGYSWPTVLGPYADKHEADKARARLRYKFTKERREGMTASFFVRPLWKDDQ